MKIHQVGSEMLKADGQTGMAKVTFVFRNFVNALNI
jgi:hypothetical protein